MGERVNDLSFENRGWEKIKTPSGVVFRKVETDPQVGITTTWTKDLQHESLKRIDDLGNGVKRKINDYNFPVQVKECILEKDLGENWLHLDINIYPRLDMIVSQVIWKRSGGLFDISYENNSLKKFCFDYSHPIEWNSFEDHWKTSIKSKIQELWILYQDRGELIFSPDVSVFSNQGKIDEAIDIENLYTTSELKSKLESWDSQTALLALLTVEKSLQRICALIKINPDQKFIRELSKRIIAQLPKDFNLMDDRTQSYWLLFYSNDTLSGLLMSLDLAPESMGDYRIEFSPQADSSMEIKIIGNREDILQEINKPLGEKFRYEDKDYQVEDDGQGNLALIISDVLNRVKPQRFKFKKQIDYLKLKELISDNNPRGVEACFDLTPLEIS